MSESRPTEFYAEHAAAEQARLQLVADCDQRWAQAREWLWNLDACVAARIEELLTGGLKPFRGAVAFDDALGLAVQHLAALALDELLARGGKEDLSDA